MIDKILGILLICFCCLTGILIGYDAYQENVNDSYYQAKIERLELLVKKNKSDIKKLKKVIDEMSIVDVKATAYNAVSRQTDNDPMITSCMSVPTVGSIAVSQDLYYKGWTCGKRVHLDQLGIFTVKDVFPKYYKGKLVQNQIDVLTETEDQAFAFGVKHNVKAVLLSNYEEM